MYLLYTDLVMRWVPKIISLMAIWGTVAYVVVYIDPELLRDVWIPGMYAPFQLLLGVAVWYTVSALIKSYGKAAIISLLVVLLMSLSILKVLNWISTLAIVVTTLLLIYHSLRPKTKPELTSTN